MSDRAAGPEFNEQSPQPSPDIDDFVCGAEGTIDDARATVDRLQRKLAAERNSRDYECPSCGGVGTINDEMHQPMDCPDCDGQPSYAELERTCGDYQRLLAAAEARVKELERLAKAAGMTVTDSDPAFGVEILDDKCGCCHILDFDPLCDANAAVLLAERYGLLEFGACSMWTEKGKWLITGRKIGTIRGTFCECVCQAVEHLENAKGAPAKKQDAS